MNPRRGSHRLVLPALLVVLGLLTPAAAHDGGFGHSRGAIFVAAEPERLVIEYRITQNRDEALIEMTRIDRNHDGTISTAEQDAYFAARGRDLAEDLYLRTTPGGRVPLKFVSYELKHPLVQVFRFTAATRAGEVLLDDRNFPHKPGAIRIHSGTGVKLEPASPTDLNHAERLSLRIRRVP